MRRGLIAILAAIALPCLGDGLDLLRNGDFESVEGWNWDSGATFCRSPGEGRNLSAALSFDIKPGDPYAYPSQRIALSPGTRYHVEGWIRAEGLNGAFGGARFGIDAVDASGKTVCQYSPGVLDSAGVWKRVEMEVEWPEGSSGYRFVAFVERGCTGRAWFDDLRVVPVDRPFFGPLISSSYRNRACGGKVSFCVPVEDMAGICARGVSARFRLPNGEGGWVERSAGIDDGAMSVAIPVESLPKGRHPVQFVADAADGSRLAFREIWFERGDGECGKGVRLDAQGRTLVDGKPFFPIGIYAHNICEADAEIIGESPFNAIMSYMDPDETLFDRCHRHGLKIIGNLKHVYAGGAVDQPRIIQSEEDECAYVADKVGRLKDHPALLAWYAGDEMGPGWIPALARRRDLLERLDPCHPVWTVQYQIGEFSDYLCTFDVAGADPYPITGPRPDKDIAMPGRWTRAVKAATFGIRPIWMVPQFFDPEVYSPKADYPMRAPTEAELRNMCWQCIAEGANGIVVFAYMSLRLMDENIAKTGRLDKEPFAKKWSEACRVAREISDSAELLLSDDATAEVRMAEASEGISVRAWRKDGELVVLVVNGSYASGKCRISAAGASRTLSLPPLDIMILCP